MRACSYQTRPPAIRVVLRERCPRNSGSSERTPRKTPPGSHLRAAVWQRTQDQNQIKVTLRPTISRSVHHGIEPHLGLMTRY
jgi:hypothetical protein